MSNRDFTTTLLIVLSKYYNRSYRNSGANSFCGQSEVKRVRVELKWCVLHCETATQSVTRRPSAQRVEMGIWKRVPGAAPKGDSTCTVGTGNERHYLHYDGRPRPPATRGPSLHIEQLRSVAVEPRPFPRLASRVHVHAITVHPARTQERRESTQLGLRCATGMLGKFLSGASFSLVHAATAAPNVAIPSRTRTHAENATIALHSSSVKSSTDEEYENSAGMRAIRNV